MTEYGDNVRQYMSDGELGERQWGTINFCQAKLEHERECDRKLHCAALHCTALLPW